MASEKFETANHFISVARKLHEAMVAVPKSLENGLTIEDVIRQDIGTRLELALAARAVMLAPHDPEAEKIIGAVLLGRIDAAAAAHSPAELEASAAEALDAVGQGGEDPDGKMGIWLDLTEPITTLAIEALRRAEQQNHDLMVEGLRRGAEQTPGFNLQITEIVGDTVVLDETVLGPESGYEDSDVHRVGRVASSVESILGIDDDRMETDVSHLLQGQAPLVLKRNNLAPHTQPEQVRLAVSERLYSKTLQDLEVVGVTGDLPSPVADLEKRHFPALRAQLMLQHNFPLTEGATLSRANRGDHSAQGILMQLVILGDLLSSAKPYFLPGSQLRAEVRDEDLRPLPADQGFLVWHDTAVHIGEGVDILAWLFATDAQGGINPVVHVIRTVSGGALETSWCSLREGEGSQVADQITRLLRGAHWNTARPLRLPKPSGSKEWKKALVRSSARAKEGGLHGLQFLAAEHMS
ncbi:hypothetical protein J2T10_004129 [Paenarthrobacter nicotinovorans]|uniref:Uncharacterized protein n=1 Tax=Paenarthrobacter nicotinovorans TaxID=29320 RepID=A0ABT9TS02_PAENI|nr:hypothetical protein [Paenarthrobacter nicotinovorans]MDQ0104454.1 hypothetical protein [Paenarthrobacter nicotinovorans]